MKSIIKATFDRKLEDYSEKIKHYIDGSKKDEIFIRDLAHKLVLLAIVDCLKNLNCKTTNAKSSHSEMKKLQSLLDSLLAEVVMEDRKLVKYDDVETDP